jgi:hypothetical protein
MTFETPIIISLKLGHERNGIYSFFTPGIYSGTSGRRERKYINQAQQDNYPEHKEFHYSLLDGVRI